MYYGLMKRSSNIFNAHALINQEYNIPDQIFSTDNYRVRIRKWEDIRLLPVLSPA